MTMSCDDTGTNGVQRFEVFTGPVKRRDWPPEVKASIVAESYSRMLIYSSRDLALYGHICLFLV